jgi:transcriptional regulator with XRE-family HTH domain
VYKPSWPRLRNAAVLYQVELRTLSAALGMEPPRHLHPSTRTAGTFPRVLIALRTWAGASAKDTGAAVGVSPAVLRGWEQGRTIPTFQQLERTARALNLSTHDLARTLPSGSPNEGSARRST